MRSDEAEEFKKSMKRLCAVLGRRFDESLCDAYWSALRNVSLDQFRAKCALLIEQATTETKFPRPGYFKPQAPLPVISQEPNDGFKGDRWDVASNHLLIAYIRGQLSRDARKWGDPNSPQQARATGLLVKHKKAWAALMRDWGVSADGELEIPPAADQNSAWRQAMDFAEAEIAALRKAA